jgi:hypothetical protein
LCQSSGRYIHLSQKKKTIHAQMFTAHPFTTFGTTAQMFTAQMFTGGRGRVSLAFGYIYITNSPQKNSSLIGLGSPPAVALRRLPYLKTALP